MSSRLLMSATAVVLGACGIACVFAPQELLALAGAPAPTPPPLALGVQAFGALQFGMAMLDWMARGAPFGGIYGRPIAIGNLVYFLVLAPALGKAAFAAPSTTLVAIAAVATLAALAFVRLVFFAEPGPG